jgi:carbon storage regulator
VLVFTRRRHEAIRIGDRIEIRILRVGRDGVRIGITAPPDIPVHREEVYEEIRAANRAAVAPQGDLSVLAERLRQS